MRKYLVVIEKADGNFSAYAPDIPGCATTGKTLDEVKSNIREALALHLAWLREANQPLPEANSVFDYVDVPEVPGSVSDEVRAYVSEKYIEPARRRGERTVTVRAGDVHKALGLRNRVPLVIQALTSGLFQQLSAVHLIKTVGPKQSTTTELWFEILQNSDGASP